MFLFLLAVAIVFIATGTCALVEAALYAVRGPYIHRLIESNHPAGIRLQRFKEKMDYPITAILMIDTLLGVGGAAIAGAQAQALYGPKFVYWFTIGLALMLLVFAQIVPKILGVVYNQPVARFSALPISLVIWLFYPFVRGLAFFTKQLQPEELPKQAIEEDVKQMARISEQEGSILEIEAELIQNSLRLNDVLAKDIMTPRAQVVDLPNSLTVREAMSRFKKTSFSRIPIFSDEDPQIWNGLVMSREILLEMANDRFDRQIRELAKPLVFVADDLRGHLLLNLFLQKRSHLFAVKDSTGKAIGVVSLEDVVEEILGDEIIDEKE